MASETRRKLVEAPHLGRLLRNGGKGWGKHRVSEGGIARGDERTLMRVVRRTRIQRARSTSD